MCLVTEEARRLTTDDRDRSELSDANVTTGAGDQLSAPPRPVLYFCATIECRIRGLECFMKDFLCGLASVEVLVIVMTVVCVGPQVSSFVQGYRQHPVCFCFVCTCTKRTFYRFCLHRADLINKRPNDLLCSLLV